MSQVGHLYLINQTSDNNKKLVNFLQNHLPKLITGKNKGFKFQFTVVSQQDGIKLKNQGITQFPTLMIKSGNTILKKLTGLNAIELYCSKMVGLNTGAQKPKNMSDDDAIEAFRKEALGNITRDAQGNLKVENDTEENESDQFSKSLQTRIQQELDTRRGGNPAFGKGLEQTAFQQPQQQTATRRDNLNTAKKSNRNQDVLAGDAQAVLRQMPEDKDNDMLARFLANQETTPM